MVDVTELPGRAVRQMTHDTTNVFGRDACPKRSHHGYGVATTPLSYGFAHWGRGGAPVCTTKWVAEGTDPAVLAGLPVSAAGPVGRDRRRRREGNRA